MKTVNFMAKLLDGIEVEWKSFGEVAKIQRGASPRPIERFLTTNLEDKGVPWIKIGDTLPNSKYVEKTKQKITVEGAAKSRILKKGDFIMSNSMSFGRPYILNIDGAIHDGWASISEFGEKLDSDFLYHYLSSNIVQSYWISKINSSSVSNLNLDIINSLSIPIPPLHVQAEIVSILDAFTENTEKIISELKTELEARKKQYTYYRDKLLSFEDGEVEWKTLGDVLKIRNGKDYKQFKVGSVPVYGSGGVMTSIDTFLFDKPSVLIPRKGSIDKLYYVEGPFWTVDTIFYTDILTNLVVPKFVFYYLKKEHLEKYNTAGGVPSLTQSVLNKIQFPLPLLVEQTRIVSILDKFEALTTSITENLSREIELRQKQYEYYRDMLLSFPKKRTEV